MGINSDRILQPKIHWTPYPSQPEFTISNTYEILRYPEFKTFRTLLAPELLIITKQQDSCITEIWLVDND